LPFVRAIGERDDRHPWRDRTIDVQLVNGAIEPID
jgi:hypothetical protein